MPEILPRSWRDGALLSRMPGDAPDRRGCDAAAPSLCVETYQVSYAVYASGYALPSLVCYTGTGG
eukprot:9029395-Pyramimonas_sp.AAC.1